MSDQLKDSKSVPLPQPAAPRNYTVGKGFGFVMDIRSNTSFTFTHQYDLSVPYLVSVKNAGNVEFDIAIDGNSPETLLPGDPQIDRAVNSHVFIENNQHPHNDALMAIVFSPLHDET